MNELGGSSIESICTSRKHEEPQDLARVLSGYCDGIVIRTHEDELIDRMIQASRVPIINGLSQLHHPCQILADLMTLKEVFTDLKGLKLTYMGDGNNILHSLLLLAPQLGLQIRYSCPSDYQPNSLILKRAKDRAEDHGGQILRFAHPQEAVEGAHAVYTDVWTSMGCEAETLEKQEAFAGFQLNEELLQYASEDAVIMHCLPMIRGKEISNGLPEHKNSIIFKQSENRLHLQKALLMGLL
ncbi:unnamed protein product [Sphagnum tenellum]